MTTPSQVGIARKVNDIPGDLRVDQYLTNWSVRYRQAAETFIAPKASTSIPVLNESDKFAIFPRGSFWRDEAEVRPLGGRPVQVGWSPSSGQYLAEEWALETTIDDRQRRNAAAPYDLDEAGVALLEGKQLIRQDRIWASQFFKPGVWAYDMVGGGAGATGFAPFDDVATDPVATLGRFRRLLGKGTGFKPNTLVLGANVVDALEVSPSVTDRVKYTQLGILTEDLLARMFKVDNVVVAESMYNTANEGAADNLQYAIDPNGMWLGYIAPQAAMNTPTAIARFAWTGLIPGATNNQGGVITRGRDDRAYTDWIHSRNAFDLKIVASDLGLFFTGASNRAV